MAKIQKTICEQLNEIVEVICTNYCKYPGEAEEKKKNNDWLFKKYCDKCPLSRM